MAKATDRKKTITKSAPPEKGTKEHDKLQDIVSKLPHNPKYESMLKERMQKGIQILGSQLFNGANLPMDQEIRNFLAEYNSQVLDYRLRSMPPSFNVMEAFFNFIKVNASFELLEEENYIVSFFDFVDFITSNEFNESKENINQYLVEDLVYHFNISNSLEDITFQTDDGTVFVVGGVSIIRRGNETIVFLLAGKVSDADEVRKRTFEKEGKHKNARENAKSGPRAEGGKLFGLDGYLKTYAFCRIDLEKQTIDARYIQYHDGTTLTTITDDRDLFFNEDGNIKENLSIEFYQENAQKISQYSSIFEVVTKCLYLPFYFQNFEEHIEIEEHQTQLSAIKAKPLFRKDKLVPTKYKIYNQIVYFLRSENRPCADTIFLGGSEFKINRSGFWKTLLYNELGKDKDGKTIHGKTWVDQVTTWYEPEKLGVSININKRTFDTANAGVIYILRNASHAIDIFKIGLSKRSSEKRAKELSSSTGAPDKFLVVEDFMVKDCVIAEKLIFDRLYKYRLNNSREFFKIPLKDARSVVEEIVKSINEE